jgi:phage baseplate assembly protein W
MAFGAKQIYPNDLNPRRALGVKIPFNGEVAFTPNYLTKDAIKNNLINYLLTNPGERIANPSFGAGLRRFIFSQIEEDNLDYIKEDIQTKINTNFNNIVIESLVINQYPDNNTINVVLSYSIPNTGINDELELSFS